MSSEFPLISDTGKAYKEYVDEDGELVHEFEKSGVIRRVSDKTIKRGFIRKENATALGLKGNQRKREKPIEIAREGLLRGVKATKIASDWGVAWEHIIAAQAELALAVDMGGSSTRAAEFIARMADLDPSKQKESIKVSDGQKTLSLSDMSPDRLDYILAVLNGEEIDEDFD